MEKGNKQLLAGCIILYHPNSSVIKNVGTFIDFVNVLYVIDNSEKIDEGLIKTLCLLSSKIIYLPQNKNVGVATALNISAKLAVKANYNWLLTMDQDSYFAERDFFHSWKTAVGNTNIGLIAASYTKQYDRWHKEYSENFNEIHFIVTSGNIINLMAWNNVKGFEEKLFIDEVDHDYCLKLRQHGYKILISTKVFMKHFIGDIIVKDKRSLISDNNLNLHSPVRYYYIARNVLYLCKKYFFIDFRFVTSRFYYLIKRLSKIILLYPDKALYLRFFFAGVKDFALSNYYKHNKH